MSNIIYRYVAVAALCVAFASCTAPAIVQRTERRNVPTSYANDAQYVASDTLSAGNQNWRDYFNDSNLTALIDTALRNNQELNITTQEIQLTQNEVLARSGAYRPFVTLGGGIGVERAGRHTLAGSLEETAELAPEVHAHGYVPNFIVGPAVTWEVDIWHKLRNAKQSAVATYLASIEGRNFAVTNLVAEIANSYYELLALDNQLDILKKNIDIQTNALKIVRQQKEAAKTTELAVRRFEAQVLNTQSRQYTIQQQIIETQNRINFLVGRYPQPVARNAQSFGTLPTDSVQVGSPAQLFANRPDIRQAELALQAAKIDVTVARANFYPSLLVDARVGLNAFSPAYLLSPQSLLFSLVSGLAGPIVNKYEIKARYYSSNVRQTQAVLQYEKTVLNAYTEVANQVARIGNLRQNYALKAKEVDALTQSISISDNLFRNARADYMEVLLTQRDALESRFDLLDTKLQQLNARVNIYRALGGGWK